MFPAPRSSYTQIRQHQADALEYAVLSYRTEPRNTAALATILRMMEHVFMGDHIAAAASRRQDAVETLSIKRKTFFHNSEFAETWSDNAGPNRDHRYMSIKDLFRPE